jgi:hypothetical protein
VLDFRTKTGKAAGKDRIGMTSKPPYEMAASGHSDADPDLEDLSDQITVDPSQDVTVEASEEATLEVAPEQRADDLDELDDGLEDAHANTLTPPPLSVTETPAPLGRRAPTLMGLPLPSLPLPGVTAATSPGQSTLSTLDTINTLESSDDDVTVMARPSVTDDDEEATKVEPAETALHAMASKDDDEVTTALSAQASVERERALRKSIPPSLDMPLSAHGYGSDDSSAEFEDPEDDDGIKLGGETPGIAVDDDAISTSSYAADSIDSADAEEPSSELEAVLAPRRPTAALGSLGSLGGPLGSASPFSSSPVLARPDAFGAARLPTPSPGFGLSIPSPAQVPAPSASPFSARLAPVGSPYAARGTTSSAAVPALQIPAPSGAAATTATDGDFGVFSVARPIRIPLGFVVAVPLGFLVLGLVIGTKYLGNRLPVPALAAAPSAPAAPIVIQPVAQPAAPAPAATTTAVATPPPATAPATPPPTAAVPTPPPPPAATAVAEETPPPAAKPAAKPVIKRAARPAVHKTTTAALDIPVPSAKPAPAPKAKPAAKPAKAAKGWVDPFAE